MFIGPLIIMILLLLQIMVTLAVTGLGLVRLLVKLNLMALFVRNASDCVILCFKMCVRLELIRLVVPDCETFSTPVMVMLKCPFINVLGVGIT